MRKTVVALCFTLAFVGGVGSQAFAQTAAKTARGTVTAMAADSLTVKVANVDMTFTVDAKTTVTARGAGTKAKAANQAGMTGPKMGDVIKVGQAVSVSYHDMGGTLHAASITAIADPGGSPATSSTGTVQSVSATSMTITGSSGSGATFTQTFMIGSDTKVVGKGASTATKGAKVAITDLVASGDRVSVSFHEMGGALHASTVTVTMKSTK
jgi:Domain of unknown function (DUF5666)